jgi:hypothetical protein
MKCFLMGMAGAIAAIAGLLFFYPQYSDYKARAETSGWLVQLQTIQDTIAREAIKKGSLRDVGNAVDANALQNSGLTGFMILDGGTIVLSGGSEGQVVVLVPSLRGATVTWHCIGGSTQAVPGKCHRG